MAKPKPRASEPARPSKPAVSSGSTTQRKASTPTPRNVSQPVASTDGQPGSASAKFYDGPTVQRAANGSKSSSATKVLPSSKGVVGKAPTPKKKRSCFGLALLLPLLIIFSLFSTILCPPPSQEQSSISRYALKSLGLTKASKHSALHETLCYPANVYHDTILEPYVLPIVDDARAKLEAHPVYKEHVQPVYKAAKATAVRVWNGPVKPVVNRIRRGARKFHLTYVQPRLPIIQAKFIELTAPITLRAQALYDQHAAHHVKTAKKHACTAVKQGKATYRHVASHPLTAQAGKHAQTAFQLGKEHSHKAYKFSKPHVITGYNYSSHHAQHTVLPRILQVFEILWHQFVEFVSVAVDNVRAFYDAHLAEHLDPYVKKAETAIHPYRVAFHVKVYKPYIQPAVAHWLPAAPQPPKTFWTKFTDKLPVGGNKAQAENPKAEKVNADKPKVEEMKIKVRAEEKPVKAKVVEEKAKAKVIVNEAKPEPEIVPDTTDPKAEKPVKEVKTEEPTAADPVVETTTFALPRDVGETKTKVVTSVTAATTATAASASATATASAAAEEPEVIAKTEVDPKAEAVAKIAALKKKIDFQGKAGLGNVQSAIIKQYDYYLGLLPDVHTVGKENLDRDIQRMLGGLERLYTTSRTLTREQVEESTRMANEKVVKMYDTVSSGLKSKRAQVNERIQPDVEKAQKDIQKLVGPEYEALGKRMSVIDGIGSKDWSAYKALKKDVDSWSAQYADLVTKPTGKALRDAAVKIQAQTGEVQTYFDDLYESFRETQRKLQKLAHERIQAREATEESATRQAPVRAGKPSGAKSAQNGRVSIQPVPPAEGAGLGGAGAGSPVIGKSQEQVVEALKEADAAAAAESAKTRDEL